MKEKHTLIVVLLHIYKITETKKKTTEKQLYQNIVLCYNIFRILFFELLPV